MNLKRWLIVISTFVFVFLVGLLISYQYLSYKLNENSVAVVDTPEDAFVDEFEVVPEDLEIITEEEYNQGNDVELEEETDEEMRKAIEEEYKRITEEQEAAAAAAAAIAEEAGDEIDFESDDSIYRRADITDRIYNVLLIGDDARIHEPRGRSDTMILVTFDRDARTICLTSFMRDMLVPTALDGGSWNRINSMYRTGGPGRAINVMNNLFSLDIQRYIVVRFASVFALVDLLDGMELTLKAKEANVISNIFPEFGRVSEGPNLLNGRQVLAYSRMRKIDSDLNRTERQRYVVRTTMEKVLETRNIGELLTLAGFALENIETNIPLDEIITLGYELFTGDRPTVKEMRIPIDNSFSYGRYYGASILTIDFARNIKALHEFAYGSSAGVRIPNFTRPALDPPGGDVEDEDDEDDGTDGAGTGEGGAGTGQTPGGGGGVSPSAPEEQTTAAPVIQGPTEPTSAQKPERQTTTEPASLRRPERQTTTEPPRRTPRPSSNN